MVNSNAKYCKDIEFIGVRDNWFDLIDNDIQW